MTFMILGGLGLIITAIMNPEGVAGGVGQKLRQRARARRTDDAAVPARTSTDPAVAGGAS